MKHYRYLLLTYLRPQWRITCLLVLVLFTGIAFSLLNPYFISRFIDGVLLGEPLQVLINLAVLFLIVAFCQQLFTIVEGYSAEFLAQTTTNQLRANLLLHCLRLDLSFHSSHTPGEFIERIDSDVSKLGNFFSRFLVSLLGNFLLLIGVLVIFFLIDWRIGLTITGLALISLLLVDRLRMKGALLWERESKASADVSGFIEERIGGTEDIRSSGAVSYMVRGLAEHTRALFVSKQKAAIIGHLTWGTIEMAVALGSTLALAWSIYLYGTQSLTIGMVYLTFNYTLLLATPLSKIIHEIRDLQEVGGSVMRVFELMDTPVRITDGAGVGLAKGAPDVAFQNVSFHYSEGTPVLTSLSFALAPGQVLGLLGHTGSGKSTCTKLLTRMYDPVEGVISLDGTNIRDMRLDEIYQRIGMITQDVHILHATLRDNLTLFDPKIPDERIVEALELLGMGDWYRALPQGLDTRLAADGMGLSAGESQLLAFARVFLKDPGLIILDEASSRLDPATEQQLERAIDRLLEGRTGIIIAHRLATVQRADTILLLDHGACCEYGSRVELATRSDSRFSHLLRVGLEEVLQ